MILRLITFYILWVYFIYTIKKIDCCQSYRYSYSFIKLYYLLKSYKWNIISNDLSCRYRFLRSQDREMNKDNYPALNFPEIYLLEGGYKAFYQAHMVITSSIYFNYLRYLFRYSYELNFWPLGTGRLDKGASTSVQLYDFGCTDYIHIP